MSQKNIKDSKDVKKDSKKIVDKKEEKKSVKKVEDKKVVNTEVNERKEEHSNKVLPKKAIQLSPQDAYKMFNQEQQKLKHLHEDIEKTQESILEIDKTLFALKEISSAKDKDIFVSLGLGVYAKAKLEDNKNFYLATNTKAVLTRDSEKIISQLTKRKTTALNSMKKLQEIYTQTQTNVNQLYTFLSAHEKRMKEQNKH